MNVLNVLNMQGTECAFLIFLFKVIHEVVDTTNEFINELVFCNYCFMCVYECIFYVYTYVYICILSVFFMFLYLYVAVYL